MAEPTNPAPVPDDESKKDTVRINLPPGLTAKGATSPAPGGPATVKLKPAAAETSDEEAKKETAVMGRPAATPRPKSDTSRVQVAAQPGTPETPRPTVKLRQAEAPAPAPAPAAPQPIAGPVPVAAAPSSALDGVLALVAMVAAIAVAAYLFTLAK